MNKLILSIGIVLVSVFAQAQMILEYDIATPNTTIALPLAGTVNVSVDWGDGYEEQVFTTAGDKAHTFATTGTKTVTITGTLSGYGSNTIPTGNRLSKVLSWDGLGITSFAFAFKNASILTQVPNTLPESVLYLNEMLSGASTFNQNIGEWNTGNVTNMSGMFHSAYAFNQNIGSWNTSNVIDMSYMFTSAYNFNQNIGEWNTRNVTKMSFMFFNASYFNQNIGTWSTSKVTDMSFMFAAAYYFNQNLGTWNISNVVDMNTMFYGTALCTYNYDQLLKGWATQTVHPNVDFDAGSSKYSAASTSARAKLVGNGWKIKDADMGITDHAKCITTSVGKGSADGITMRFWPNPVNDKMYINSTISSYQIVNQKGIAVLSGKDATQIDCRILPIGLYTILLDGVNHKFVKE